MQEIVSRNSLFFTNNKILVTWRDSSAHPEWLSKKDLVDHIEQMITVVNTIGYYVWEDENFLVIAASYSEADLIDAETKEVYRGYIYNNLTLIPKGAIITCQDNSYETFWTVMPTQTKSIK